jgi:hypothetical protein
MTTTLTSLYDNYGDATRTVEELEGSGISHADISMIANQVASKYVEEPSNAATGAGTGATIGAVATR